MALHGIFRKLMRDASREQDGWTGYRPIELLMGYSSINLAAVLSQSALMQTF